MAKNICVIGIGYVGLPAAAVYADWGNNVVCIDINQEKLDLIQSGHMPIFEPGVGELVARNIANGRLSFSTSYVEGIKKADLIFICVGTPALHGGAADLSAVLAVAEDIAKNLDHYAVVVIKSTVPVGTNELVEKTIKKHITFGVDFDVASCPEFLAQGKAVHETKNPSRTVIGAKSKRAVETVKSLYQHLNSPIIVTDLRTAEISKYGSNAILASQLSFVNQFAKICERAGANVLDALNIMGNDPRIGSHFLEPSLGWGGSCFPKDTLALSHIAREFENPFDLLDAAISVNQNMYTSFVDKVFSYFGTEDMSDKTFALLGLAFKAGTDDVRSSIALEVAKLLRGAGALLRVHDPKALEKAREVLGERSVEYCDDPYVTIQHTDGLFILTEWEEYKALDLKVVRSLLREPVIFDGRNALYPAYLENQDITYFGVGVQSNGLSMISVKDATYRSALLRRNGAPK